MGTPSHALSRPPAPPGRTSRPIAPLVVSITVAGSLAVAAAPVLAASPPSAQQLSALTTAAGLLQPGSVGPAVVVLQDTLADWGQTTPEDGTFGPATQTAVEALAARLGAGSDPLATQLALIGFGPRALLLGAGNTGPEVAALQRALTRAGYGVEATGILGPQTQSEVEAFQAANGLAADDQISLWGVEAVAALEGDGTGALTAAPPDPPPAAGPAPDPSSAQRAAVVGLATSLAGRPYVWGGVGPWGFDCSGLVEYVFGNAAGVWLPHSSYTQWDLGAPVGAGYLQPGDLVFFSTDAAGPSHVGVYVGGPSQDFVDATNPDGGVQIDSLYNAYWGRHYVGARDVLG